MLREAATVVHFVPSMLDVFLDEARSARSLPDLRLVFASGEALGGDVAARTLDVLPRARLHNLYGPTEAAVDVTWQPVLEADREIPVPIGRPVPNTRIEVLSTRLQRCPPGVPGELCLGGVQLARGYVGRPGLTAERFIPDPYGRAGGRLYRTGDLVRLRADGVLEYLGRLDTQTKINGLRIELGEIEVLLAAQPEVRAAAVTVVDDGAGKRLVAYLVPAAAVAGEDLESADWAGRLRERLPSYMIPAQYVPMAELPVTRNGKLDRLALPVPGKPGPAAAGGPLASGAETAVARVWGELLRRPHVGPEDDFFSIGGDSMRSLKVVSRLRAAGYVLTLEDLFTHSTPRALARLLEEPGRGSGSPPRDERRANAAPVSGGAPANGAFRLLAAEDRARLEAIGLARKESR
jgi:aryl carrier-like protein